jgi:hypothetical protein
VYGANLKVWQVYVAGVVWIAAGAALGIVVDLSSPEVSTSSGPISFMFTGIGHILYGLRIWITLPVATGLYHFYAAWQTQQKHRNAIAEAAAVAAKAEYVEIPPPEPKPRPSKPLPPVERPPMVETDPFRAPPQPAPLAIVRAETAPPAAPRAETADPDDKPRYLN